MPTNTRDPQERTARVRPTYFNLGVDAAGVHHTFRATDETVHVVDPDHGRQHVYDVAGRPLDEYMQFVAGHCGWDRRDYGLGVVGCLERALGEV